VLGLVVQEFTSPPDIGMSMVGVGRIPVGVL
jgi:hypothetical protein